MQVQNQVAVGKERNLSYRAVKKVYCLAIEWNNNTSNVFSPLENLTNLDSIETRRTVTNI